ncbi:MAG: hypothetical protein CM1200mP29_16650 [Verrucomicrobiota bacterium]|nr:MAG: hypothetical protein CM1200mP29_16650 [Verrucomicrobiota bacterium]
MAREVEIVALAGSREVHGLNAKVNGPLPHNRGEDVMSLNLTRQQYAEIYGPTTGDQVRLGDTDLFIEVDVISSPRAPVTERGQVRRGKVIRDGMGQSPLARDTESLDVCTNA